MNRLEMILKELETEIISTDDIVNELLKEIPLDDDEELAYD